MTASRKVLVVADPVETAAKLIQESAADAIANRGRFIIALSGGSTPLKLFVRLTEAPYRETIDWSRVYFLWGDERSVPPDHPESNYRMAHEALLGPLAIAPSQILRMEAEREDLAAAANEYDQKLRTLLQEGDSDGRIDLVLLGMGADGHTASLFPHTAALNEQANWAAANNVPQLKTRRMTLTYPVIAAARRVLFLATGREKAETLKEVLEGPLDPSRLPSQIAASRQGETFWIIDEEAGANLIQNGAIWTARSE
jgi:6-phosphogluconolactonase